jgi:hypothetical protein
VLAVLDETFPEMPDGIAYVVGSAVVLEDEAVTREALSRVFTDDRRIRPFHWHREGPEARARLTDCLVEIGAVAHVCVHYPTGRKKLEAARRRGIEEVLPQVLDDGATELIIESRGPQEDTRDRGVILDVLHNRGESGSLSYDWKGKTEELLWLADGVCGAVREHLLQTEHAKYYDRLTNEGVLNGLRYLSEAP